jgi:DNA-binding IclR family transcriptional regulator
MRPVVRTDAAPSVVERVSLILSAFRPADTALGTSELSRRTGLPKSTVHRLVHELERYGLLEAHGTSVRLGLRLFEIGQRVHPQADLRELATPLMADLREATRNTVHLAVLDRLEVVYLQILTGPDAPKLPSRIGGRLPAHATGIGKAILAHSPTSTVEALLRKELPQLSRHTICLPERLRLELSRVRAAGVAYDREESCPGVICVAVPILGPGSQAVGAVSVSGWCNRLRPERVAPLVRATADALSRAIRAHPSGVPEQRQGPGAAAATWAPGRSRTPPPSGRTAPSTTPRAG